jgi:hypothetical protein
MNKSFYSVFQGDWFDEKSRLMSVYGYQVHNFEWTQEVPTREGWYWARTNNGHPYIVKVGKFGLGISGILWVYMVGSDKAMDVDIVDLWLGPLPIPDIPTE